MTVWQTIGMLVAVGLPLAVCAVCWYPLRGEESVREVRQDIDESEP